MKKDKRIAIFLGLEKCKGILEAIDYWIHEHVYIPIHHVMDVVCANIDMLCFMNKEKMWYDWDYEFSYEFLVWKLKRLKDRLAKDDLTTSTAKNCKEIEKAIYYWNLYQHPEIEVEEPQWMKDRWNKFLQGNGDITEHINNRNNITPEQEQEELNYYTKLNETEEKGWKKFHETLKKYARGWWN